MGNSRERLLWGFGFGLNPRTMTERTENSPVFDAQYYCQIIAFKLLENLNCLLANPYEGRSKPFRD
jgi:hypothetical protein